MSDAELSRLKRDPARYHWIRQAWLEGADTGEDPEQLMAISTVYTEDEMDAAIDAEVAKLKRGAT